MTRYAAEAASGSVVELRHDHVVIDDFENSASVPYFPAESTDCPTFVDDSEWCPLVDEHLHAPLNAEVRASFEDLDVALGIWRAEWLPPQCDASTWRQSGHPVGYTPAESVLRTVWP